MGTKGQPRKKTKKTEDAKSRSSLDEESSANNGEAGSPNAVGDASHDPQEVDSAEDHSNNPEKRVEDEDANEDVDALPDVTSAISTGEEKEEEEQSDMEEEDEASSAASNGNSLSMSKTSKSVGGKKKSSAGAAGGKKKAAATAGGKKDRGQETRGWQESRRPSRGRR